jgi:hypothetical protein
VTLAELRLSVFGNPLSRKYADSGAQARREFVLLV